MSWIKTIDYDHADARLKRLYNKVKGPGNNIDNVLLIHSLRPHTLMGHMTLYKSVLHNSNNTLPKWYLESIGVYVSHLNDCSYCVSHHLAGLQRLLGDDEKTSSIRTSLINNNPASFFESKYLQGLRYAQKLTVNLREMSPSDIALLKTSGFSDGEILEINQVASYFNYVNRMVVGLGVTTEGDILGLSPTDNKDPKNWKHI